MNTKIIEIINKKIAEHKVEVDGCEKERTDIQAILKDKEALKARKSSMGELLQQSAALSYKYTFHKAAMDVLSDLLKDIKDA